MLYKSMRPEQINVSEEQVSQVTKIFDREYENPFGIHADEEKLVNISSGAAQDDDIAGNILNMVNVRKKEWKILDRIDWFPKRYHFMDL